MSSTAMATCLIFSDLLLQKFARKPIVSTIHGWTASTQAVRTYECIDKRLMKYFDTTIPVSQQIENTLIHNNVPPSKITTLHNIIDHSEFTFQDDLSNLKTKYQIETTTSTLGVIGRLSKEKGHVFLLHAIALIKKDFPNIKLLIIGDGDQRLQLEDFSIRHKLENEVVFCGFQEDISSFYHSLTFVFFLP